MDMTSAQAATPLQVNTAILLVVIDAGTLAAVLTAIYPDGSQERVYSRAAGGSGPSTAAGYTISIVGNNWTVSKTSDGGWTKAPTLSLTVMPLSGSPITASVAFILGGSPKVDGPITWQDVIAIAPELVTLSVETQNAILIDAIASLNPRVWKKKYQMGLKLLCAHVATIGPMLAGRGPITSQSVGPMSQSYAAEASFDTWGRTGYGAQLRAVKRSLSGRIGGIA